jgi:hypothetical protein
MRVIAVCLPLFAAACFAVGLVALRALRLRLELVGRAEHELRGPATALSLACQQMRHDPAAVRHADVLEVQLERLRAGLDDLTAARRGGWKAPVRGGRVAAKDACTWVEVGSFVRAVLEPWRTQLRRCTVELPPGTTVPVVDRGRLAQTLGNLLANSAEHGAGDLRVRARRVPGAIRLEVRNGNLAPRRTGTTGERGLGLEIAAQAARDLGGRLLVQREESATVAMLELPDDGGVRPAPVDVPPRIPGDPAEPDAVA